MANHCWFRPSAEKYAPQAHAPPLGGDSMCQFHLAHVVAVEGRFELNKEGGRLLSDIR